MNRIFTLFAFFVFFFSLERPFTQTAISIVPPECYPGVTPSQQDASATSSNGASPFATWKSAYNYAHTGAGSGSVTSISFAPGYYPTDLSLIYGDWGDADGGFVLKAGITVNGNGAVIDNTGAGSSQLCFATMGNNSNINGFTFIDFSGTVSAGAIFGGSATGWTIANCNFDGCDKGGGSAVELSGGSGTLNGCNFYNHLFATGSAMDISGGTFTLNNCTYSCNYRDNNGGRGGAIYQTGGTTTFNSCVFDGNTAGGNAPGGAMAVQNGATTNFNSTKFTCNTANVTTNQDGGALNCESGATVNISNCYFKGNIAKRNGGAIRSAGGSSSSVNLTITNTTFENNSTNTAGTSKGGAIELYNTVTNLSSSYFTGNSVSGEGGAVYVAANESGNTATYTFTSNTMTSNTAGNNQCTGRDVFTEMHINGSNNNLDALADGNHSSIPGSLEFNNGGTGDYANSTSGWNTVGTVSSNGDRLLLSSGSFSFHYANRQDTYQSSGKLYWTFTMYTANTFSSDTRYMAYCLGGTNSDFTMGNGFAVVKGRDGTSKIEFCSYTGGLDNTPNFTVIQQFAAPTNEDGYIAFRVSFTPSTNTWNFWYTNSNSGGDVPPAESDPRGFIWCPLPSGISSSFVASPFYYGPVYKGSSSNQVFVNSIFYRPTDETLGSGASGASITAACAGCPDSPTAFAQCPAVNVGSIQGDAFSDLNNDGIMNPGEQLANVPVQLLDGNGNVLFTTYTNSSGHYIFTGLPTGTYQVRFGIPSGYSSATTTSQNNGVPAFDSDVPTGSGTTFLSPMISLNTGSGMSNGNDDFTGAANYYNVTAGYAALVLPVTWSSISVDYDNCNNILRWTTESETNNDYFVVETSRDAARFESLGMVDGNGDSRQSRDYLFTDHKSSGTVYYRIKQVDHDGRVSYSEVVRARNIQCREARLMTVYPNPVNSDHIFVEYQSGSQEGELPLTIINQVGQVVWTGILSSNADEPVLKLDISSLIPGLYMISATDSRDTKGRTAVKFIKH